jgi:hypothetical protein
VVRWIVAYAVWPSGLTCAAPSAVYGLVTCATCGACATRSSIAATGCCTELSLTDPWVTCQTIVSDSPAWVGNADCSRLRALVDSVPGNAKLSLYPVPTAELTIPRPTSAASHSASTVQRWRKHQRATAAMDPPELIERPVLSHVG